MTTVADLPDIRLKLDTARFGPFEFEIGVDVARLSLQMQRVEDAHKRFATSPLAEVANTLEKEVIAGSIFGTNTIEGGVLTEEETAAALELDPKIVQEIEQRRVVNIKAAYNMAKESALTPGWTLSLEFIRDIHGLITDGLPHPDNQPRLIRDTPRGRMTHVGDEAHGGCYKPPQYGGDVWSLLEGLIAWHAQLELAGVHPLIRAPLVHYYYELIHPFWDGNGRVGRVLEATLLLAADYRYAPFAMARYYLENIDAYFTLFNRCRKLSARHESAPNTEFVLFHQVGMLETINRLHDRVNRLIGVLLFESKARHLLDVKQINVRQYTIISQILGKGSPVGLEEMRHSPWYLSLYLKLNEKTRSRDLKALREMELLSLDADNKLWPGFIKLKSVKRI